MKKGNISNKQISINMIANIISYSSNLIISFILTPFLINSLGKETYAFYPIANTIVSHMSIITNSMNTMASRFITISLAKGNINDVNKYFSSVLASNSLFGLILLIPMVFVILFLDIFMEIPINSLAAIRMLFLFVFASALVNIFGSIFGIATFAKNRIDLRSVRELFTSILKLLLFIVLYKIFTPSIVYIGIVTFIVSIINVLVQYFYTKKLMPEVKISKRNVSWKHTKELLLSSIWNMINTLGNALLVGLSIVLANMLYGASASGSYSIVQVVPQFISGIVVMISGIFFPVITHKYAKGDKEELIKEVTNAQKIISFVTCATICVFASLSAEFFALWTPTENSNYLMLLSCLSIIPYIFIGCMWPLTNLNIAMNKVKVPALFTLVLGISNVILSYIGYKYFSLNLFWLPTISAILQAVWMGILIPQYACYNLNEKWNTFYQPLIKVIIASIPTITIVLFIKQFVVLDSWLKFIVFGGCMGIIGLLIFGNIIFGLKNFLKIKNILIKKYFDKNVKEAN